MEWSIAKAKERFSEVRRQSALEPQPIYNRDRRVAAVISAESFKEYLVDSLTVATRNVVDFEGCGISVFDPFA